jgi:hypothetical protein
MRENNRSYNAWIKTSNDEGRTWSKARQLPAALSGDRHASRYTADGRLFIAFRDTAQQSPTRNHFVGWVGTYDDIIAGREGQYRVKLLHSHAGSDCGYAAVERLADDTIIATTYVKYRPGPEKHSVVSVRLKLEELDARVAPAERKDRLRSRPEYYSTVQFSIFNPVTRENSDVLFVTRVVLSRSACAAIKVSSGPMGVPRRSRSARTFP